MSLLINILIEVEDRDATDDLVPDVGVLLPSLRLCTAKARYEFASEILMYICC